MKRRRSTERESNDQILEIEPQRIKSTKLQHQLKFNSTNQTFSKISCEQICLKKCANPNNNQYRTSEINDTNIL